MAKSELIITRVFNAPQELVWKAWTEPEYIKKWWAPKTFTCPVSHIDFHVGGKYHTCMLAPDGEVWSTGVYIEIIPLEKIVCTDSFADPKGNIVPASYYDMEGEFPLEMIVNVTFEDFEGKTKMTLRHIGLPEGKWSEMTSTGWNEMFDKLEDSFS